MHGAISKVVFCHRWLTGTVVAVLSLLVSGTETQAQLLKGRLRPPEPEIEAIAGEPYGVGRWTVPLPAGVNPALLGNSGFTLTEKNGRAMFQAFQAEPLRSGRPRTSRPAANGYCLFSCSPAASRWNCSYLAPRQPRPA